MTPSDQAPVIAEAVERVRSALQPIQIILFGSRARGDHTKSSDLDLLVVMPDAERSERAACQAELHRCLSGLPLPVDVLVTTPERIVRRGGVAGTVLHHALSEGRVIYEAEDPHMATALEWLESATNDLDLVEPNMARLDERPGLAGPLAWQAHQIVEKSLKAALFLEHQSMPRTHDLDELVALLPARMQEWVAGIDLAHLFRIGLGGRYPDNDWRPQAPEARQALADARRVYEQVAAEFQRRGVTESDAE